MAGKKFDGKCNVLLVLAEKQPELGEYFNKEGYVLRVEQWYGTSTKGKAWQSTKLAKRKVTFDDDQAVITTSAVGLTVDDLDLIFENRDKIKAILNNPPDAEQAAKSQPAPAKAASAPAPADDGLEEVPF